MIGSLASMSGYLLVVFILQIWMVVKVARSSPILAVGMFLFWPLSIVALFLYWKDKDSDIKVPFLLALLSMGLAVYMAFRAVGKAIDESAAYFTDDEIAEIRKEDPAMADQIEAARAKAWERMGKDNDQWLYDEDDGEWTYEDEYGDDELDDGSDADSAAPRERPKPRRMPKRPSNPDLDTSKVAVERAVERTPEELEAERRSQLRQAASSVSFRLGTVRITPANAQLALPKHFRFVTRDGLAWIARAHGMKVDAPLQGWAIHDRMDLGREDAWFVELRFVPADARKLMFDMESRRQIDVIASTVLGQDKRRDGPVSDEWDGENEIAMWSSYTGTETGDERADFYAVRRLPKGLVVLRMQGVEPSRHDLARHATRLLARRVTSVPSGAQ